MSNVIWLTVLRGVTEKTIDNMLSDENLSNWRTIFEAMKPAIHDSDDAIFGYVIGHVIGSLETIFNSANRQPTNEEINEIVNAITKRVMDIRSRINQTKT